MKIVAADGKKRVVYVGEDFFSSDDDDIIHRGFPHVEQQHVRKEYIKYMGMVNVELWLKWRDS